MTTGAALPKYIQISEMLIREIAAGRLVDGARLPPEREMADELAISVGTLRKALGDLADKGLLERVQGSGNYVRQGPATESVYAFFRLEMLTGGGLPTAEVLTVDHLAKDEGVPAFGQSDAGHRIRRLRSLGGDLVALEEIWLDAGYATAVTPADLSESLYHFYRNDLGLVIGSVEDMVGVGQVPTWAPTTFHMRPSTTAGYIERLSFDSSGDAAEFSRTWFDHNKARYVSRMGKG
ncbi:MAG: GntR family transcriptional regulator [Pseudomonadota bacterium]